ncbi:MAG: zinc-ribbon domain-containing protein [Candidatus Heimdallarchaeota archaeon]|nr:zinc-ribbon domain-containing protein [Candidatus Heimdallarchaeota archaeon]
MSSNFCPNCGNSVKPGAKFCEKCGYSIEAAKSNQAPESPAKPVYQQPPPQQQYSQPPQQPYGQPPPQYQQGGFMGRFSKPPDYIRPPNYVFTTTLSERIVGTMKMNVHVVEEIEDRPELQDEAKKLLLFSLLAITILNIVSILTLTDTYKVDDEIGTIVNIILVRFAGGYVYIYLLAKVGQSVGGQETRVDLDELMRVLSYAYFAVAIYEVLSLLANSSGNLALAVISGIFLIYTFILFAFVIRRALDKGYGTAILTIIIAFLGVAVYQTIVGILIFEIFGDTYSIIDPL